ncbi:Uncharacterised protein [Klebsiella pneumoniae]|uniref:hypothetical protein n=1 Tax=Klebsiella pneumoniae TaxID=573 RepID=UPI0006C266DC|nr:hypothetical protein [Klebsiella pneumoniae]HBQ5831319.1 hypothetical protein [Klebsiella pneumoniae subsp. pneumoniae]MDG3491964.1 hypothetical protein [Klebsiella pneumoniae]MDQ4647550.1 hypothetical protein [Klebsiella pneumoniae]TXU20482.1 hypothetical protein D4N02_24250 [Klebsiella pneumoniae]CTQ26857.1 conserved hypothetical protein [Klebsiella pneumoniae]
MTFRLTKIDELTIDQHYHLDASDTCFFFGEYTARKGFGFSETNQLIHNLKKSVEKRGSYEYRYKGKAINKIAQMLVGITNLKDLTFVPIPPSKCHEDPLYDGRMIEVLESAKRINADIDYRELVRQRESRAASHNSEVRQTPEEIASNYIFERSQAQSLRKMIVIFDDVLTAGSHYKAMKAVIRTHLPESVIVGLFVARTAREAEIDWFEDLDESDEF